MKSSKGFTLIELLVVIAIIGILSSVVLASLNTARAKGSDSAIKAQLASIRPQAELFYDNVATGNGSYATTTTYSAVSSSAHCTNVSASMFYTDTTIRNQIAGVINSSGGASNVVCALNTNASAWAITAVLKTTTDKWCVDSTGASKQTSGSISTTAICP